MNTHTTSEQTTARPLSTLKRGESGNVCEISGGRRMTERLNALGIIPQKRVKMVSSTAMRGPVTIEVDRTLVAIGFGMAQHILINVDQQ